MEARGFDAIDLGRGRKREQIDALPDSVVMSAQVSCKVPVPHAC